MSCHFWCDASQYEVYVMQIFILYFKFKHLGGKEGKKKNNNNYYYYCQNKLMEKRIMNQNYCCLIFVTLRTQV